MAIDLWLSAAVCALSAPAGLCAVVWWRLRGLARDTTQRTAVLAARLDALERRAEVHAPRQRLDARARRRLLERLLEVAAPGPPPCVRDVDDSEPEDSRSHATTSNE